MIRSQILEKCGFTNGAAELLHYKSTREKIE